ncbi:MAG: hypothetical protein PHY12_09805 [Eubacteriales bacterium]|nr:hypothetical protein [Eubacteriales bacterium]
MKAWKICAVAALVLGAVSLLTGALANVAWIQMAGDAPGAVRDAVRLCRQQPIAPIAAGLVLLAGGVLLLCMPRRRGRTVEPLREPPQERREPSSAEELARRIEESEIDTKAEESGEAGSIEDILESLQGDPLFNRASPIAAEAPQTAEEAPTENPPAPQRDEPARTYATFHFADVAAPPPQPDEKPDLPVYEENADPDQTDAAVAQKHISGRIVSTVQPRY